VPDGIVPAGTYEVVDQGEEQGGASSLARQRRDVSKDSLIYGVATETRIIAEITRFSFYAGFERTAPRWSAPKEPPAVLEGVFASA
jgi:hypothetical protein